VKRTFAIVTAATLGIGLGLVSGAWAQTGGQAAPASPLRTRVALVNMVQVLKQYKKFSVIQEQLKAQIQELDKQLQGKRNELIALKNNLQTAKTAEEREPIESKIRQMQLSLQAEEEDARRKVGKLQGEHAVQIYREVEEAVKVFAQVNDIELVLHFNDAAKTDTADYYSPNNVSRKMLTNGPLMPMHWDPRMDITPAVVQMLNAKMGAQ